MRLSCRFVLDAEVQAISAKMDVVNAQLPVSPGASAAGWEALGKLSGSGPLPCRIAAVTGGPCRRTIYCCLEICGVPPGALQRSRYLIDG